MRTTLIGVLSLIALAGCGGDSIPANRGTATAEESVTPTLAENPSVTPSPAATAPAPKIAIGGVAVTTLTADKNEPLPPGHLFYVLAGCTGCDGPVTGIDRVYTDQAGKVHTDRVFERPNSSSGEHITSVASSADGHHLVVGVCQAGASCGGVGNVDPAAKIAFYTSENGGISWSVPTVVSGGARVVMSDGRGPTLIRRVSKPSSSGDWVFEYGYLNGGVLTPPGQSFDAKSVSPLIIDYGLALVPLQTPMPGLYRIDGASNPDLSPELPAGAKIVAVQGGPGGGFVIVWRQEAGNAYVPAGYYIGVMDQRTGPFARIVRLPNDFLYFDWRGMSVGGQPVLNVIAPPGATVIPAIVDLASARIKPIEGYFGPRSAGGERSHVIAIAEGPFVRVQGAGDCLTVRAAADATAQSLGCFKDRVLLKDRQETRVVAGATWVGVVTPDGVPGWASAQFLDVTGRDMSERPAAQPSGTRTGDANVDPVIAALESGDPAAIVAATRFTAVPCAVNPQGLGAPPTCQPGVAEGTPIEAFPAGTCEGYYILKPGYIANPPRLPEGATLWAVVKGTTGVANDFGLGQGGYAVIYAVPGPAETSSIIVFASEGKMTARLGGCQGAPAEALKSVGPVTVVLAPK